MEQFYTVQGKRIDDLIVEIKVKIESSIELLHLCSD